MARIQLRLYIDPGQSEVSLGIKRKDGSYERMTGVVDTGAAVSLLPNDLLDKIEYRAAGNEKVTIDQAGIAQQAFEATEAFITLFLEDQFGSQTADFEARVWFADTSEALVGFDGILDRAILHIDMPNRSGWIEIDP